MDFKHYSTRDIFQANNDLLITLLGSVWSMSHEGIPWDCRSSQYSEAYNGMSLSETGKDYCNGISPEYTGPIIL